jgi:hypothetical protein
MINNMNILLLAYATLIMMGSNKIQEDKLLFNGVSLDNWEIIDFEGHGNVSIVDSCIVIDKGDLISGIRWTEDFPKTNYEINLDAKRVDGRDFFCGMTFPVKESFVTLVLGGWGGSVVGLSSIDGYDAANNQTGNQYRFASGWWYGIHLRVTDRKIEAWIEGEKIVDFTIENSRLSLRSEVESSVPFGITTYKTTGALRKIRLHMITE